MRDYDIRNLLRAKPLLKYKNDGVSRIVEELQLAAAYATIDMAVINGHLHGFEIKSACDTLQRLPKQIEAYTKVFDYLYVVTEEKHYSKLEGKLPDWIGVYLCSGTAENPRIKKQRPAKKNKYKDGFYIAKLLWRSELTSILDDQNISYRKKDRNWILCEKLSESLNVEELSKMVRIKLKARPANWKSDFTTDYVVK